MKTTLVKLVCPQLSEQALRRVKGALTRIIFEMHDDKTISSTSHSIEYEDVPEDGAVEPDGTQPSSHEANVPDGPSQGYGLIADTESDTEDTEAHGAIVPDGPQPSSHHEESDKESHGAIVPAGSQPSSHHQEEEYCTVEDIAKPLWESCVSATRRLYRLHWKSQPRCIRGAPNPIFREAEKLWKRLPMMIVSKEEKLRIGKKNLTARLYMRRKRRLLS